MQVSCVRQVKRQASKACCVMASFIHFTSTDGVAHVQMDWALQGVSNLSYDPMPPLPTAASPPGEAPLTTYPFPHFITTCCSIHRLSALQQPFQGSEALCGLEA